MPSCRRRGSQARAVLAGAAVSLLASAAAASECLKYEPVPVTVSGKVSARQAYGPPGYGETPKRDRKESYLLLTLDTPICVEGDPGDPLNGGRAEGVKAMQMIYSRGRRFDRKWLGQPVVVTGTLFRGHSGHHRTDVLIEAAETLPNRS